MKKSISTVEKLLQQFSFTEPVDPAVQEHIRRNKNDQFGKILNSAGGGSLFFSPVYRFFFFMKSAGFGTTVTKSALILITAGVLFLSGVTAALYFTFHNTPAHKQSVQTGGEDKGTSMDHRSLRPGKETAASDSKDKQVPAARNERACLYRLTGRGIPKKTLDTVTLTIFRELNSLGGKGTVSMNKTGTASPFIILGEVDSLEKTMTISLRLVDRKTGKIAAYARESAGADRDITAACRALGRTVLKTLKASGEGTQ